MGIKVTIGGDFCVTSSFTSANLFNEEVIDLFKNSDLNILNLECPVLGTGIHKKIKKSGPHLYTNYNVFNLLKQINTHVVTLANNHILDYGIGGINTTLKGCTENNILTTGAGHNAKEASQPVIIKKKGVRIALVNFCEHEFSIATKIRAGANPLDLIDNLKQIKKARTLADFVFVIIHGGHEHYNLPSPRMVKQYRFFAENGADAVIGHHTHCISGFENHNGVPIFYGLGNLLFTMPYNNENWNYGLLVQFEIEEEKTLKWRLIPTQQSTQNYKLSLCHGNDYFKTEEKIKHYNSIISQENLLNKAWESYARDMESQIINDFSPINILPSRYFRAILRKLGFNRIIFRERYLIPLINLIECESLYDLSQYILNSKKQ